MRDEARDKRLAIAVNILQQLGGSRFKTMTGAKNFLAGDDYLSFKLPSRLAKNGINYVKITLTEMDVYIVFFGKIIKRKTGWQCDEVAVWTDVYNDGLQRAFAKETGLDTHL